MKFHRTAILGAGSWGTALALLWSKGGNASSSGATIRNGPRSWERTRENSDYLPGMKLPPSVTVTSELAECSDGGFDRVRNSIHRNPVDRETTARRSSRRTRSSLAARKGSNTELECE